LLGERRRDLLGSFPRNFRETGYDGRVPLEGVDHRASFFPASGAGCRAILAAVATEAQVERTLKELIKRFNGAKFGDKGLPEERILVCHITDHEASYRSVLNGGRLNSMAKAEEADADVRITIGSDDLVALAEGRLSPVFAFLSGRLRIDANARDMLILRQLF
jgi:predicted lipid carrier protein YhbT